MTAIFPIQAFKDNYIWCWVNDRTHNVWVVDPGESQPVVDYLDKHKRILGGILVTHHHWDHTGGIEKLVEKWPNACVIGGLKSKVSFLTERVGETDKINCGSLELSVCSIPGHTLDHVAYYNDLALFCGDTLFSAGCGRVFEGTASQMYDSLNKLASLPKSVQIYCGHEYTENNLLFALTVEPENTAARKKLMEVKQQVSQGRPSLPVLLKEEFLYNPFLRCEHESVRTAAEQHSGKKLLTPTEVFAALRIWKNDFTFK